MAVDPVTLATTDGLHLEAELSVPGEPWAAAVLAHPHPEQGGSMRSLVTGAQFAGLPPAGVAVLRFNFRGVGRSDGQHGGGVAEQLDVVAAVDALHAVTEGLPLVLAGWSFGAEVALAVVDDRLDAWVAVAPPFRVLPLADLVAAHDPRPKLLLVPERDPFCAPVRARATVAGWTNTEIRVAPGADHFLVGRTDLAVDAVVDLARTVAKAT